MGTSPPGIDKQGEKVCAREFPRCEFLNVADPLHPELQVKAVSVEKHACRAQCGALVAVDERMVHRDPVRIHGRQLREAAVVSQPRSHHSGLEQSQISEARRTAEARDSEIVSPEHLVDIEE
jgi:hypothetical protein